MSTGETPQRTPDQNLQLLLDRYSLVGRDDQFSLDYLRSTNDPRQIGQRAGYLYGELTAKGLVHVIADPEKSDYANAHVLVIDHSFVTTRSHINNRRTGDYDWQPHTQASASIALASRADSLTLMPYHMAIEGKHGEDLEQAEARYTRTVKMLARFASISGAYDALHQTRAFRYPPAVRNLEQLYPYAGQNFGPRVNVEEMLQAGVAFHPAVELALRTAPKLIADN